MKADSILSNVKNGKFVYKNKDSMKTMHEFYDKTLASLCVPFSEEYFDTSFGKTHCLLVGDPEKPRICTIHGGNGITTLNLKLFLPLLEKYCIIAPENDIFFPAGKVFAKAKEIFAGPVTTLETDSKHLPSDETMADVCKRAQEFFAASDNAANGDGHAPVTAENAKVLAACGNDCAACPRYIAHPYEKTEEELHHTAALWFKIGYRDHVVTNEEISCTGCKPENWCRYHVVKCCEDRGIKTCTECGEYPCANMKECFEVTKSFEPICKKVCTDEEYEQLKKAFFEKEKNLSR